MDSLLLSRIKKDKSPNKLQNLSPQKYGKAAWADLTYTPSKLADNILYREVNTLKKTQQGSSKLRQFQTLNGFMKERVNQLQLQRDGIQSSLNQQIGMYKKMLHESEVKHESRLKDIQKRFSNEISILIQQKQQEAKFSQAEKQILQNRISQLQQQIKDSLTRENELELNLKDLKNSHSNLTEKYNDVLEKSKNLEKQKAIEQQQARKKQEDAKKKHQQTDQYYKEQIQGIHLEKAKQKEVLQRLMKTELQKAQNLRVTENLRKSQQLREVMIAFENETKRLSEIISMKDRMLEAMTLQNTKNKEDILNITQSYQNKVKLQSNENQNLVSENQQLKQHISLLESQLEAQIAARKSQKDHLSEHIQQLKSQLQYNQINYVRQRDKFQYWGSDLQKQIIKLKGQNMKLGDVLKDNERLSLQLMNLRDLLMESSFEIQRSKEQLTRMAFERDSLALKAEKVLHQNDRIYRMKRQFQQGNWKAHIQTHRPFYR